MRTIYKYPLALTDAQVVYMSAGAKVLTAQLQQGRLMLWAEAEPNAKAAQPVSVYIATTGNPLPEFRNPGGTRYVSTFQLHDEGTFVGHVYVEGA